MEFPVILAVKALFVKRSREFFSSLSSYLHGIKWLRAEFHGCAVAGSSHLSEMFIEVFEVSSKIVSSKHVSLLRPLYTEMKL